MKIATFGAKFALGQLHRTERAFVKLGHQLTQSEPPDLIYCNNAPFKDAIEYSKNFPKAKRIFKVLDLPEHLPNFNEIKEELTLELWQAHVIVGISHFVCKQLNDHLGITATNVGESMNDVYHCGMKRDIDFLYVGRANDPNKRFNLIFEALDLIGIPRNKVVTIGDSVEGCQNAGQVHASDLNYFYNRAKIMVFPSRIEGLGLPPIEAAICGCIPVCCTDNLAAVEVMPDFCVDPNHKEIAQRIMNIKINYEEWVDKTLKSAVYYPELFGAERVAARIIEVYKRIL